MVFRGMSLVNYGGVHIGRGHLSIVGVRTM